MCAATPTIELKPKDFKGLVEPDWCPGCGDFGVLNALQRSCADLGIQPLKLAGLQVPVPRAALLSVFIPEHVLAFHALNIPVVPGGPIQFSPG